MNETEYEFTKNEDSSFYFFLSRSEKKDIVKIVRYDVIEHNDSNTTKIYNLSLLDYDYESDTTRDNVLSNNDDIWKLMKTILVIILDFLKNNPDSKVFITGSDEKRNQFYNSMARRYQQTLQDQIIIHGTNFNFESYRNSIVLTNFERNIIYKGLVLESLMYGRK